ncbi:MAG: outer membrane lipoprotein-sorting protein [Pseudomonadota bacterium]
MTGLYRPGCVFGLRAARGPGFYSGRSPRGPEPHALPRGRLNRFLEALTWFGLFTALAVALVCSACDRLPQPAEVLEQAKAKEVQFELKIKDLTMVQSVTSRDPKVGSTPEVKTFRKNAKCRIEAELAVPGAEAGPGATNRVKTYIIHDGLETWIVLPVLGKTRFNQKLGHWYGRRMYWWQASIKAVEVLGAQKVGGRDCWVLAVNDPEVSYKKLWVDKKTLSGIKAEAKGPRGENLTLLFSDFRDIGAGFEWPFRTEMFEGEKMTAAITVLSVKINQDLPEELFDPDKVKFRDSASDK